VVGQGGPDKRRLRLSRERAHANVILAAGERHWGWQGPAGEIRWRRRLELLVSADSPGLRVLEVGAGSGTFTRELALRHPGLVSVDISPELLALARSRAPSARLVLVDAHELAFAAGCFDRIVGCSVLHHLEWQRALLSFYRALKPGGVIRFSEPNLANPQILLQKNVPALKRLVGDSPDEYAFTAGQIRSSLERAGFVEVRVEPFEFLHPATPRALVPALLWLERLLERTPLRRIAGSLRIEAKKPDVAGAGDQATGRHRAELLDNERRFATKPLLAEIYRDFYREIARHLAPGGRTLELGSGMGLVKDVIPGCETTDLFSGARVTRIENAYALRCAEASLRNLILVDVFHHLQYPGAALLEFARVLEPGGRALIFEPALSLIGLLAYGPLHHEGLGLLRPIEWLPPPGFSPPGARYYAAQGNAARVFLSDRHRAELSSFDVTVHRYAAFSYLASGGFRGPQLYPARLYPWMRRLDDVLGLLPALFAGRMLVVLEKRRG
jgi:ubiquinone/menaquinone biosynthesis C-methylase UbiE